MMVDIANEQTKNGHRVVIIIVNKNIDYDILKRISSDIKLYLINRTPGSKSVYSFIKLYILFKKLAKFDIIHSHGTYLGGLLKHITTIKMLHTVHDINHATSPLKHYNRVFAISNAVKHDVENQCNIKPIVVYNGIKTKNVKAKDWKRPSCSEEYKLVCVSRLEYKKKGQDILLYALNRLLNENKLYDKVRLDFVGDGIEREQLEELSTSLGLANIVNFIGNKSREWVYEHLADYNLFIQPSRYEGFGLTVAEAMAAKLPVIAAHNDGPAEILANGKYGFLFENGNAGDLASKIFHVIELLKQAKLDDMVENAYQYCLKNFDINITASKYVDEYAKLIGLSESGSRG